MAKRTDNNQAEIVEALRSIGATVVSLHEVGRGVPDLLVGYRGKTYLVEVKSAKGKPNARQERWYRVWDGAPVILMRTVEDVRTFCNSAHDDKNMTTVQGVHPCV